MAANAVSSGRPLANNFAVPFSEFFIPNLNIRAFEDTINGERIRVRADRAGSVCDQKRGGLSRRMGLFPG
jgi:hypothetical protein